LDRASDYGSEGLEFESLRVHQEALPQKPIITNILGFFINLENEFFSENGALKMSVWATYGQHKMFGNFYCVMESV
jgi:hypothetical protein